jgi:putative membrane protein
MYIDYLTLMLINLTAGLVMLALWVFMDSHQPAQRRWVTGFLMSGAVASVTGLHMILTWPLPGSFNIIFGEMSVFFGVLMLGLAFVVWFSLDLLPIAVYGTLVGIAALILGAQVLGLGLTQAPTLSGVAFLWMGVIGVFSVPMLLLRKSTAFRTFGTAGLALAALLWGLTGYMAYWGHVKPFGSWKPAMLKYEMEMQQPAPQTPAQPPAK